MKTSTTYLHALSCTLGERTVALSTLAEAGLLTTEVRTLHNAGFSLQRVCDDSRTALDLAQAAARPVRARHDHIDMIMYATALPTSATMASDFAGMDVEVRHLADFPATRLQAILELPHAQVLGVAQQACTGFIGALRSARAYLHAESELRQILCVCADRVPPGMLRESSYNPLSDAAIACVVSRDEGPFELVAFHQHTNGGLATASADQVVGTYFTEIVRSIEDTLRKVDLRIQDVSWIVPQNLPLAAWKIVSSLLGTSHDRVHAPTRSQIGHLVSGCNFANLLAIAADVKAGQYVLLPVAGYGLHWQTLLLRRTQVPLAGFGFTD